jgi:DNA-binding response OmpR family regulator
MMTEILFVDDDPLIVETLTIALEDEFIIFSAESREETKNLIRKLDKIPSIALIDLGLPPHPHHPEEGFKLIQELLVFNPDIKILVLSGQSESTNIQHALTLGAVDFVSKPCDVPLLRSRLLHQQMMLDAEQIQEASSSAIGNSSRCLRSPPSTYSIEIYKELLATQIS